MKKHKYSLKLQMMALLLITILVLLPFTETQCPTGCWCSRHKTECMRANLQGLPQQTHNETESLVLHEDNLTRLTAQLFSRAGYTSLHTLVLDQTSTVHVDNDTFKCMSRLTTLAIRSGKISNLQHGTFQSLHTLSKLDLSRNRLHILHPHTFAGLAMVRKLDLSFNLITELLINSFDGLKNMNCVSVVNNRTFTASSNMLDLSHNPIHIIETATFHGLCVFTQLNLNGTRLTFLYPDMFQGLSALWKLRVSYNGKQPTNKQISSARRRKQKRSIDLFTLSENLFQGAQEIRHLDLYDAKIRDIVPGAFNNVNSLQYLNLFYNRIQVSRRDMFNGLRSLRTLKLGRNSMHTLEAGTFQGLSVLTSLDLTYNKIQELLDGTFQGLDVLVSLKLNFNRIQRIQPAAFIGLAQLQQLDLSNNKILIVQENTFSYLPVLRKLVLAHNNIQMIESGAIQNLTSLKYLDLTFNRIRNIDNQTFDYLPRLDHVDLRDNTALTIDPRTLVNFQLFKSIALPVRSTSDLTNNTGVVLRGMLQGVQYVQHLMLQDLHTVLQPADFVGFHFLSLEIRNNRIPVILPNTFIGLPQLRNLIICYSEVRTAMPGAFRFLNQMTRIDLTSNSLSTLVPGTFEGLVSLENISLQYNYISYIADGVFSAACVGTRHICRHVTHINMFHQNTSCDASHSLTNLRHLDLGWNEIAHIHPHAFIHNEKLQSLVLPGNRMLTLNTNFLFIPSLTNLDMFFCNVSELTLELFSCTPKLKKLNVASNRLQIIDVYLLKWLTDLEIIQLYGNNFLCDCHMRETWQWISNHYTIHEPYMYCKEEKSPMNEVLSALQCDVSELMLDDTEVHVFQVPPLSYDDDASFKYGSNSTARFFKLHVEPYILWTIFSIGIVGNGLLLIILAQRPELCRGPNSFILNLALADILSLVVNIPLSYFDNRNVTWDHGLLLCKFFMSVRDVSVGVTIFSVVMLSVHRYRLTVRSFQRNTGVCGMKEHSTIRLSMLVVWAVAVGLAVPTYLTATVDHMCLYAAPDNEYMQRTWTIQFVIYCAGPVSIISFLCTRTACYLKQSTCHVPNELRMTELSKRRLRLANMVVMLTIVFSLSYIPNFLIRILVVWSVVDPQSEITFYMCFASYCLFFCNSCLNPIVLFCQHSGFRDYFLNCCVRLKVVRKPQQDFQNDVCHRVLSCSRRQHKIRETK